ncbi:MAG: peptidase C11, partial [Clostridia bacterium]|nr:peptidase C11 [Clostridia bacterium]
MNNRPTGRDKHVTGQGNDIRRRGEGLGTGPVGKQDAYSSRRDDDNESTFTASSAPHMTRAGGKKGIIAIIIAVVLLIIGGRFGLPSLFGGGQEIAVSGNDAPSSFSSITDILSGLSGGGASLPSAATAAVDSGWTKESNNGKLDTTVASDARAKYTKLAGNGSDTVTVMVYMCGTDLESKAGMATNDIAEMANAKYSDKVNVLVYTGGCKGWKNKIISNSVNQIYHVGEGGKIRRLVEDDGKDALTKPATLTRFIKYATQNFPANRNILILWDHGGGSITGFG